MILGVLGGKINLIDLPPLLGCILLDGKGGRFLLGDTRVLQGNLCCLRLGDALSGTARQQGRQRKAPAAPRTVLFLISISSVFRNS